MWFSSLPNNGHWRCVCVGQLELVYVVYKSVTSCCSLNEQNAYKMEIIIMYIISGHYRRDANIPLINGIPIISKFNLYSFGISCISIITDLFFFCCFFQIRFLCVLDNLGRLKKCVFFLDIDNFPLFH